MICFAEDVSPNLNYHLVNGIKLTENVFRIGSIAWGELAREVRSLYQQGLIDDLDEDEYFMVESDAGELDTLNGSVIMLDTPQRNWDHPGSSYVYVRRLGCVVRVDIDDES